MIEMIKAWKVSTSDKRISYMIIADNMDDALKYARTLNPDVCCCQMKTLYKLPK